jgi:hypothetical protein
MRGTSSGAYMTSITLDISSTDSRHRHAAAPAGKREPVAPAPAPAGASGTVLPGLALRVGRRAARPAPLPHLRQGQQQGSTAATGEAGNAAAAAGQLPVQRLLLRHARRIPAVTFDEVKKAFLALSKPKGRALCEGVLKPFGIAKLSDAKPEQYAALLAAIEQAIASDLALFVPVARGRHRGRARRRAARSLHAQGRRCPVSTPSSAPRASRP